MAGASTLIYGGTLIDGRGGVSVRDGGVLIEGERIVAVGATATLRERAVAVGASEVDATGCWIIPGLIDCHIHATLTGLESMPVFLACGVTTVRDIGGPLDVVSSIQQSVVSGEVAGPRFIFCGPLIDGESPSFPNAALPIIASTANPEAAAALADECIARGAGSIKLYFRLSRESVQAAIERVAVRVPVTGHLGRTYASEAVAAGINGIEHAIVTLYNDLAAEGRAFDAMQSSMGDVQFWLSLLEGWGAADLDAAPAQRLLESMRERDVTLDPTLDITHSGLGGAMPAEADPNLKYVRKELAAAWEFGRRAGRERTQGEIDIAARGHAACEEYVRRYHAIGGRVTAGTDVGAVPFLVPGFSLHREIGMLVRAGLSTSAAIKAATLDAATSLRIDGDTGSIEAGKTADLVVLEADPIADIANLSRVRAVYRAGVGYEPAVLLPAG